jgi:hypothetical protein
MATEPQIFRRAVLGLQARAPDRALQTAIKMADLFRLELLGLFIEDSDLRSLATMPFAREYHTLSGAWQAIDPHRLARDLALAAGSVERAFAEAARQSGIRSRFERVPGSAAKTIASISQRDDLIMIIQPDSPAERHTQQYSWLIDAAFGSAAAVMLVPTRVVRDAGPVVVIAASPDDRSLPVAAALAAATKENLVILEQPAWPAAHGGAAGRRVGAHNLEIGRNALSGVAELSAALGPVREQCLVVSQGTIVPSTIKGIVSARRVPVLVVGAWRDAPDAQPTAGTRSADGLPQPFS